MYFRALYRFVIRIWTLRRDRFVAALVWLALLVALTVAGLLAISEYFT